MQSKETQFLNNFKILCQQMINQNKATIKHIINQNHFMQNQFRIIEMNFSTNNYTSYNTRQSKRNIHRNAMKHKQFKFQDQHNNSFKDDISDNQFQQQEQFEQMDQKQQTIIKSEYQSIPQLQLLKSPNYSSHLQSRLIIQFFTLYFPQIIQFSSQQQIHKQFFLKSYIKWRLSQLPQEKKMRTMSIQFQIINYMKLNFNGKYHTSRYMIHGLKWRDNNYVKTLLNINIKDYQLNQRKPRAKNNQKKQLKLESHQQQSIYNQQYEAQPSPSKDIITQS